MNKIETEVVVIGAGPGGYAAAFYAADRGKKVILVDKDKSLGGVCLNRGCIPSKTLLHAVKLIREAAHAEAQGLRFEKPAVDLEKLRAWKNTVISRLADGVRLLAQKRNVTVLTGHAHFEDSKTLRVETAEGQKFLQFQQVIVATGSKPAVPKLFDLGNPRVMTSTEALEMEDIPQDLLIIGGGYIGMELGTVYQALGSRIVLVEALGSILAGADADLARLVARYAEKNFKEMRLNSKVTRMATHGKQIKVEIETDGVKKEEMYDKVLISVGRVPNCSDLGLENTKVARDERGFIKVDSQQRTADPGIFAIGDVVGGAMLAHKASKEARIAVEVILGEDSRFENVIIPAVIFTDPEIAWCGLTEHEVKERGLKAEVVKFPWGASGRALSFDRTDGMTKLIVEQGTERILGVGIAGVGAGELISEGVLAMEMGAVAEDLARTVHPHPTLSETLMEAAELYYGSATHTLARKK